MTRIPGNFILLFYLVSSNTKELIMRKMFSMTATIAVMCKLCLVVGVIICIFTGTAGSDTIMNDLNYNEHLLLNKKTLSVLTKNLSQENFDFYCR